jgi:dsRNA-specific ribonuclease
MNNIKNKLITKKFVETIVNKYSKGIDFKVNNIKMYQTPFVQKSFCTTDADNSESDNCSSIKFNSYDNITNERLEFLGDKVIDFITTEFLFDLFPGKDEGFLTKLKSRMVKKESLANLGRNLGFKEYMLISPHLERNDGRNNPRFLEDIFESFIGGLYKDQNSNIDIARNFVLGVYSEFIVIDDLININDNFKDSLLRYFHSQSYGHPVYTSLSDPGNSSKEFTTILLIPKKVILAENNFKLEKIQEKILDTDKNEIKAHDNLSLLLQTNFLIGLGKAKTKKASQQQCSRDTLINLGISLNY